MSEATEHLADDIGVWNLRTGTLAVVGPQAHFNVLGNLRAVADVERLQYWINGRGPRPVYFARQARDARLERAGDFNIDTIDAAELDDDNQLVLETIGSSGRGARRELRFGVRRSAPAPHSFELDLSGRDMPAEVGQIIDGQWRIERDEAGERCLVIRPEDRGYDRIILFGHHQWTTGYEVLARLSPTHWGRLTHNLGLLFRWNPHLRGDGSWLPAQWTTGLAYYYSTTPGLRLRFGVDVHVDDMGVKRGDHVLAEKPYSWLRRQAQRQSMVRLRERIFGPAAPLSQLRAGHQFWFRLRATEERLALTVWERGSREPRPQIEATDGLDIIKQGAVGVIALNCGARVYEFEVRES